MDSQLFTLSKIFTERLFRIPDYQRGYAWTEPQLKDFWNDIQQIEPASNHYTGVLTLETVPLGDRNSWNEDRWVMESKSYEPYYVVDGQQRLTTSIILIQCIIEAIPEGGQLNYTSADEIRRKFIFDTKDRGISRSYIFGYDKDNPSYEFLKTKIFNEHSSSSRAEETVYTNNLENAKSFFKEQIMDFSHEQLESLYRKASQCLLFNIFTISEEVDVCVAFETMNNRGKPLSYLELLKNRLIYLSLKLDESEHEKSKLRISINDCWKSIYHSLGRNKSRPLDDDSFLGAHYLLYFSSPPKGASDPDDPDSEAVADEKPRFPRSRRFRPADHYHRLLQEIFVQKRLGSPRQPEGDLGLTQIYTYVTSLQVSVEHWYNIFNPASVKQDEAASYWLEKLDRIGMSNVLPLILSVMLKVDKVSDRVAIFKALERFLFVRALADIGWSFAFQGMDFLDDAILLYHEKITAKQVASRISEAANNLLSNKNYLSDVKSTFRSSGYYRWSHVRYFLYEYNLDMQEKSKTERRKIHWSEYIDKYSDARTVEHVYPQNARAQYWKDRFSGLNARQRGALRNSLGNLVPLSQPKNSSLSNKPFPDKVEGKKEAVIGFRFGCYAENEIAKFDEWTPDAIRSRGIKLLRFLERRWSISLGTEEELVHMLNLEFLK